MNRENSSKIEIILDPEIDKEIERIQSEINDELGKPVYTKAEQISRMIKFGIIAYKKVKNGY